MTRFCVVLSSWILSIELLLLFCFVCCFLFFFFFLFFCCCCCWFFCYCCCCCCFVVWRVYWGFLSLRSDFFCFVICLIDLSPLSIMTSPVSLSMPGALLFFISFGIFLTLM